MEWSHHFLSQAVRPGDWVLDATAGNGNDTAFLANLVGPTGRVFAFDVQASAAQATVARLAEESAWCEVWQAGHEEMLEYLPDEARGKLSAVLFNLGYLPGGDKSLITTSASTLAALAHARLVLAAGGALIAVTYPGHAGGDEEAGRVGDWFSALSHRDWSVLHIRCPNRAATRPPEVWVAPSIPSAQP